LPVLESLGGEREGLEDKEMIAFREECRSQLKVSNMRLEGTLSEIRAAVPKGKSVTSAEKQAYLPYLGQVVKVHLQRGGHDPRGPDTSSELLEQGVPLDTLATKCSLRNRPDRTCTLVGEYRMIYDLQGDHLAKSFESSC
jgi:hypothetical protein